MHLYTQIYEFAASAGALEGYVYQKQSQEALDLKALSNWINNLKQAYDLFIPSDREIFQSACDQTLGRAVLSLEIIFPEGHEFIKRLRSMVKVQSTQTPGDFQKQKWFQK